MIDPVAGSGSTLRACAELGRTCYGFEVDKGFFRKAREQMLDAEIDTEYKIISETCNLRNKEQLQQGLFA